MIAASRPSASEVPCSIGGNSASPLYSTVTPGRLDRLADGVLDGDDLVAVGVLDRLVELRLGVGDAAVLRERVRLNGSPTLVDARPCRSCGLNSGVLSFATACSIAALRSGVSSRCPAGAAKTRFRTAPCSEANFGLDQVGRLLGVRAGISNLSRSLPPMVATSTIRTTMIPTQVTTTRQGLPAHMRIQRASAPVASRSCADRRSAEPFSACVVMVFRTSSSPCCPDHATWAGPSTTVRKPHFLQQPLDWDDAAPKQGDAVRRAGRRSRARSRVRQPRLPARRAGRDPPPLCRSSAGSPAGSSSAAGNAIAAPPAGQVHRALLPRRGNGVRCRTPALRPLPAQDYRPSCDFGGCFTRGTGRRRRDRRPAARGARGAGTRAQRRHEARGPACRTAPSSWSTRKRCSCSATGCCGGLRAGTTTPGRGDGRDRDGADASVARRRAGDRMGRRSAAVSPTAATPASALKAGTADSATCPACARCYRRSMRPFFRVTCEARSRSWRRSSS